jgi:hypothetical protein
MILYLDHAPFTIMLSIISWKLRNAFLGKLDVTGIKTASSVCLELKMEGEESSEQMTCCLISLALFTAAVGTAWSLLGSPLCCYHFRKHSLCLVYICIQSLRPFLGAFEKLWKSTITFVMYVCMFVRVEQLRSHWMDFYEIWYLRIFPKTVEKIKVALKSDKNNGTLHEDLCTFMTISRWILLRMRNVSDKICRENQNTHLRFNNFFPEKSTFY